MEQRVSNGWAQPLFSGGQPMAGDAISGQSACPACFPYLSTALPAGDTPELLCPPEDSVRQADLCPTMAFPSASSALWSVSLLTVLFTAAVHSSIVYGKHLSPSLSIYFLFSLSRHLSLGP